VELTRQQRARHTEGYVSAHVEGVQVKLTKFFRHFPVCAPTMPHRPPTGTRPIPLRGGTPPEACTPPIPAPFDAQSPFPHVSFVVDGGVRCGEESAKQRRSAVRIHGNVPGMLVHELSAAWGDKVRRAPSRMALRAPLPLCKTTAIGWGWAAKAIEGRGGSSLGTMRGMYVRIHGDGVQAQLTEG
jgi:hypothetical protein